MWHLFHGPNDIARDEELAKMRARLGDPALASLNTTTLDAIAALKDIRGACDTVSFLADRRLVIVRNWLSKTGVPKRKAAKSTGAKGKGAKDQDAPDPVAQLIAYLPDLPESTALVLVEDGVLPETHPLLRFAEQEGSHGRVKLFDLPKNPQQWVMERAKAKGGDLAPAAAQLLCAKINRGNPYDRDHFAEDSRLYARKLDNELNKLVGYALNRRIEAADVELLVADEQVSDIFKFVDAISVRDGQAAYQFMQGVLGRGETPLVLVAMLARQTRLMICAKENAHLTGEALAQALKATPFVSKKVEQQARRFSLDDLVKAHCAILDADVAIKTGCLDDVTALDLLVAMFCG
jgi:DNA polymerase III subunit delta